MADATEWKLPWTGGCRCGQLRFRVTAPPMLTSACHCTGCQRMSASAYSLTISLPSQGFEITQGEPVIGGLHGPTRHLFCASCLSWVFTRPEGLDWLVNLRATALDDARWAKPFVEVFTSEKLPWATTPAAHSYATAPPMEEYQGLMAEFLATAERPA
jgi:hypothetical protein